MVKNSIPFSKKIGLVTEPIIALKKIVKIRPQDETVVDFVLSVGEQEEQIKQNYSKYKVKENIKKEFELSRARVEAESRYLRMKGKEIALYQKMLSYIIFDNSARTESINKTKEEYLQSELWKYGISGDLPIILVKIRDINDIYVIKEVLKAYEFFRTKNIETEIVILDEEKHSYENYVREEAEGAILSSQMAYMKNIKGGIFILAKNEINKKDRELIEFISTIVIDSKKGGIENNIKDLEEQYIDNYKEIGEEEKKQHLLIDKTENDINLLENTETLKYYNEYGGFSADGKEYLIKTNKENRLPTVWSHILANEKFGTVITENVGGYTWYKNSRLNRVSSWENDPIYDVPSEVIYLKDMESKKAWSLGLNPMPDNHNYNVVYGFRLLQIYSQK